MAENKVVNFDEQKKEAKAPAEENEFILKLSKTYHWEDETISELDFSGLENITASDMIKANRILTNSGEVSILPENDLHYSLIIASSATGHPIEFFKTLKPRDALKVKGKVNTFFYGEE